jgi:Flp pilus assembly protein TadB
MDYGELSTQVESIIKSAGGEGGTTTKYSEIATIDGQRELVISHLKHMYDNGTRDTINAKEVENIASEYKNFETTISNSVSEVRGKLKSADKDVANAKIELRKKENLRDVLKILVILMAIVAVLYILLGSSLWVHVAVLIVLLGGAGYVLYKQNTR